MNVARWLLANYLQIQEERIELKKYAWLLGTDVSVFDEVSEKSVDDLGQVLPLTAIVNPEAFEKIIRNPEKKKFTGMDDEAYEQMIKQMEESGDLTALSSIPIMEEEDMAPNQVDKLFDDAQDQIQKKKKERWLDTGKRFVIIEED